MCIRDRDEFKKDWPNHGAGKHLQQYFSCATVHHAFAIDQYTMRLHPIYRLGVACNPGMTEIIIGFIWTRHELHPIGRNLIGRPVKIMRTYRNMLNTLTVIALEIIDNLAGLATILVDGNSDTTAGRGQRPTDKAGKFTLNLKKPISRKLKRSA